MSTKNILEWVGRHSSSPLLTIAFGVIAWGESAIHLPIFSAAALALTLVAALNKSWLSDEGYWAILVADGIWIMGYLTVLLVRIGDLTGATPAPNTTFIVERLHLACFSILFSALSLFFLSILLFKRHEQQESHSVLEFPFPVPEDLRTPKGGVRIVNVPARIRPLAQKTKAPVEPRSETDGDPH